MEFQSIEILGLVAAVFTTAGFLPQILKTWRTKDVSSLSLPMYVVICTGTVLWLIYGVITESLALIFANVLAFSFTFLVIVFILKYKK